MATQLDRVFSIDEARRQARRRLPRVLFDYIDGAAEDEVTAAANRAAFRDVALRPRVGRDPVTPKLATTVVGTPVQLPVVLGPTGLISMMHPDGAIAAARAAASAGTISVLSTVAGTLLEDVAAAAPGPQWFQVYAPAGREEAAALADRAAAAGFDGLVITMDTAVLGRRERDLRHGITMPVQPSLRLAAHLLPQLVARPGWVYDTLRALAAGRRATPAGGPGGGVDAFRAGTQLPKMAAAPFTWDDVAFLRDRWAGRFIVKGLVTGDDAVRAVDVGADAVVVSNHGGRQLDGAPATLRMLPEVVDAVGGQAEVLVDGGVRRGTDIVKALALGARAVLVGRAYLWGLAIGGQAGVEHVLGLLAAELRHTLTLLGCADVAELGPHVLEATAPTGRAPGAP